MWSSAFKITWLKRLPVGLALALLLSLLLHLVMLGGEYWHLPSLDFDTSEHHVQQVQLIAAPIKTLPPAPKPGKQARQKTEVASEPVRPAVAENSPLVDMPAADVPVQGAELLEQEGRATEEALMAAAEIPAPIQAQENAGIVSEDEVEHDLPPAFTYVNTEFVVLRGEQGSKVGVTKISYRMDEQGHYQLTSTTEAKGLVALVVSGKLLQHSEGTVTSHGLQPALFSYQYGKGEGKRQQSQFDWEQHTVTLETAKGVKTLALPAGTQDLLSFMYQFIFVPPLEQMTLHISNGKKLSEYSYSFEGEETLNTEFGAVRTWHIARVGEDGNEKTELWLAVDYHYLPVKMRKTEEDGSVIEQLATQISTDLLK